MLLSAVGYIAAQAKSAVQWALENRYDLGGQRREEGILESHCQANVRRGK